MQIYSRTEDSSKIRVMYSTQFYPELFIISNEVFEVPRPEKDFRIQLKDETSDFHLLADMLDHPLATNSVRPFHDGRKYQGMIGAISTLQPFVI
jgi:hypothetical protein